MKLYLKNFGSKDAKILHIKRDSEIDLYTDSANIYKLKITESMGEKGFAYGDVFTCKYCLVYINVETVIVDGFIEVNNVYKKIFLELFISKQS